MTEKSSIHVLHTEADNYKNVNNMLTFLQEHNPQSFLYRLQPHMTAAIFANRFKMQNVTTTTIRNCSFV